MGSMKRKCFIICAVVILAGLALLAYRLLSGADWQGGKPPAPNAPRAPQYQPKQTSPPEGKSEADDGNLPLEIVIEVPEVPERLLGPSPPTEE